MANLVAVNIKRKDAEVASHGFSTFLDPKKIKLQDEAEIPEMMEEEEALADADAGAAPIVLQLQTPMLMPPSPSPLQQTQGQEEASVLHDSTLPRRLLMCPQLRTGGVEGLLVSTSFPAALELLSLLDHITTSQVLDLLLVHSEQPEPCPAGASTSSTPFLPS